MLTRSPIAPLRPFVTRLWATGTEQRGYSMPVRERVLPTGCAHLVFRLDAAPLRIFADESQIDPSATLRSCVLAGPRSSRYVRETSAHGASIGVVFRPSMASAALGVPLGELAQMHFDASAILGPSALALCEQLAEQRSLEAQLTLLEGYLLARMDERRIAPLFVRRAAEALDADRAPSIDAIARQANVSHRYFSKVFLEHVGLTPKRFARVRRFDASVRALVESPAATLAQIAAQGDFSDHAHFTREFIEHAGMTPSEYRASRPHELRHVPVGQIVSRRESPSAR